MNKQIVSHLWGVQYRALAEYRSTIFPTRMFKSRWERFLAFMGLTTILLGFGIFPKIAFADPHATFFTDRAQEQLFFNVLAALNQADYVEPPKQPPIDADRRLGSFIRFGTYTSSANRPKYQVTRDPVTGQVTVALDPGSGLPLEPNEAAGVELPRIRVRPVTSDDGDIYFRQRVAERALAEAQRVELSNLVCGFRRLYLGDDEARECLDQAQQRGLNLR
ncbi:MAG: hypothetical protein G01um101438_637 [Parcubacteria group bacterium Gr01-1014_38]|nr:MAG: hypothetical protein G01um101438_637 [Parcubacteria group bacterium Gr01-1014_38]